MARMALIALEKSARFEQGAKIAQHFRAAAKHDPVGRSIESRQLKVLKDLVGRDQIRDATGVAERLPGDCRIIDELLTHAFAQKFMLGKVTGNAFTIGQFRNLAAAM